MLLLTSLCRMVTLVNMILFIVKILKEISISKPSKLLVISFSTMIRIKKFQHMALVQEFLLQRPHLIALRSMEIFLNQSAMELTKLSITTKIAYKKHNCTVQPIFQKLLNRLMTELKFVRFLPTTSNIIFSWLLPMVSLVTCRLPLTRLLEDPIFLSQLLSLELDKLIFQAWMCWMQMMHLYILKNSARIWVEISFNLFHLRTSKEILTSLQRRPCKKFLVNLLLFSLNEAYTQDLLKKRTDRKLQLNFHWKVK